MKRKGKYQRNFKENDGDLFSILKILYIFLSEEVLLKKRKNLINLISIQFSFSSL
jgi:hypothetical protein